MMPERGGEWRTWGHRTGWSSARSFAGRSSTASPPSPPCRAADRREWELGGESARSALDSATRGGTLSTALMEGAPLPPSLEPGATGPAKPKLPDHRRHGAPFAPLQMPRRAGRLPMGYGSDASSSSAASAIRRTWATPRATLPSPTWPRRRLFAGRLGEARHVRHVQAFLRTPSVGEMIGHSDRTGTARTQGREGRRALHLRPQPAPQRGRERSGRLFLGRSASCVETTWDPLTGRGVGGSYAGSMASASVSPGSCLAHPPEWSPMRKPDDRC